MIVRKYCEWKRAKTIIFAKEKNKKDLMREFRTGLPDRGWYQYGTGYGQGGTEVRSLRHRYDGRYMGTAAGRRKGMRLLNCKGCIPGAIADCLVETQTLWCSKQCRGKFHHEYSSAPKHFFLRRWSAAGHGRRRAKKGSGVRGGGAANRSKRRGGTQNPCVHSGGEPAVARRTFPNADEAGGHGCGGTEILGAVSSRRIERGESRYSAADPAGKYDGGHFPDSAGAIDGSRGADFVGGNDGR